MIRKLSLGFLFAALVAACGSARLVNQTQYGGTYALVGDRNKAMEQAMREMARHCGPNNFTIVSQGEVPVGTDSAHRTDTVQNRDGSVTQAGGDSTRTATEWRVEYQCGQGAGAPPPAGPPGPPPPPAPAPGY
jgi:hypothetical protein